MGIAGIVLLISCVAIAIYILVDTYLGAPPKPKVFITALCIAVMGGFMIYFDYYAVPEVTKAIVYSNEIDYIYGSSTRKVKGPVKLIVRRKKYPWYSVLRIDRSFYRIISEAEIKDKQEGNVESLQKIK